MDKLILNENERSLFPDFIEPYRYNDLYCTLYWMIFRMRYVHSTIGYLWAIVDSVLMLLILTVGFNKFTNFDMGNIPHMLLTAATLSIWTYFTFVMTNSSSSVIASQLMMKKIPRLFVPLLKDVRIVNPDIIQKDKDVFVLC